jgi:hypothetical protein
MPSLSLSSYQEEGKDAALPPIRYLKACSRAFFFWGIYRSVGIITRSFFFRRASLFLPYLSAFQFDLLLQKYAVPFLFVSKETKLNCDG